MGRRPKPAALREAQGNPGRRPIHDPAPEMQESTCEVAAPAKAKLSKNPLKFAKASRAARAVYDLVAPQLRRLNFLRDSDEAAFWRYCDTMARYWNVTKKLDEMGGETYECATTNGGTMARMRPEFMVQERLAKRLDSLEDRFGLTPAARQSYMLALSRAPQMLPLESPPLKNVQGQSQNHAAPSAPPASRPSVIGGARGQVH
jgi:P27 family predicted phage terminase small subunit